MITLRGVLAPVVTPFTDDGEIDLAAFGSNLVAHLAAGVSGIVITGSTGEAALLDDNERSALVDRARHAVPNGVPLLVGTGSESTRATIARTAAAAERGADGVLVVAPHYYGLAVTSTGLRDHFLRVADASAVPVVLYSIPKYMHFAIAPEVVAELARHQNIVGIKDSAGDRAPFAQFLEAQSDSFTVLTGNGGFFAEALRSGARGGILAASLFAPEVTVGVWRAHEAGDAEAMAHAQAVMSPLAAQIVGGMGVAGVKAAMDLVGLAGGRPRPPLQALDSTKQTALEALMRNAERETGRVANVG
ncbi:MAG: dihydrodipicolinate synthase family protein [Gemmatimonadota bacterium]|nr:dihydrodipicolinate synthase family protein [Gemmatimonadota bacterium]